MLPIPKYLLERGVRDMLRISDARMSGTASGTIVLHIAPEAAVGGTLGLVQDGDEIELDAGNRRLELLVDERTLAKRRHNWTSPIPQLERGYLRLHHEQVEQANLGCDFSFLRPQMRTTLR
jgi:dihydroxy-acid dehydratase